MFVLRPLLQRLDGVVRTVGVCDHCICSAHRFYDPDDGTVFFESDHPQGEEAVVGFVCIYLVAMLFEVRSETIDGVFTAVCDVKTMYQNDFHHILVYTHYGTNNRVYLLFVAVSVLTDGQL